MADAMEIGGRAIHVTYRNINESAAFGLPPDGDTSGVEWNWICAVKDGVGALDDALAQARAAKLNDEGVREKIAPKLAQARAVAAKASAQMLAQAKDIEAQKAKFFALPEADPAKHGLEREIRERVAAMDQKQRDALYSKLRDDPSTDVLFALMRDPLMEPRERQILESIWRPRVKAKYRSELAAIADAENRTFWARSSIDSLAGVVNRFEAMSSRTTAPARRFGTA